MPKSQKCVGKTKLNELFMVTVTTKEDLKNAIETKEDRIIIKGELAQKIAKQRKASKGTAIAGGVIAAGSIIAAPFTGGMSLIGGAGAAATMSGGTIALLLAISGLIGLSFYALKKDYNVKTTMMGQELELTRK